MKRLHFARLSLVLFFCIPSLSAQETIPDVFADPTLDFDRPVNRARAVDRIRAIENANRDRAHAKTRAMGIPIRSELPNGTVTEIMGLDENGKFLIYTTHNANAAISSAANLVFPAPYNLDGTGVTVGVWDESAVRVTHTEFQTGSGSRVTVRDGATTLSNHATHVAGTVAARGASATRKGMAPNVLVDSYNWTSDTSEMTAAGATGPGQLEKITISNHSYGFATGWRWNGSNWQWGGTGTDQNAYASQYGQYTTQARDWDSIAFNAPYYLIFKSAGNDNSNNPANGNTVSIGGNLVTYDRAIHPPGNGLYRNTTTNSANGYENISHGGNAKNIMTIGAANDAVTSGLRDPAKSTLTAFSSRGPTDDGRVKPDIVANGAGLDSTWSTGDTAYSSISGTSMSSPSAAGSAALLVHLYRDLFPGGDMRASTLKGLIIHTATDIGNPGPDYHYGWGLMNTKEAADLIIDHHSNPERNRMIEDQLTTSTTSRTYSFTWDGVSPIRATMCWTDPAGVATSTHDLRSSRLINDLDLKIIAPDGTQHYPFVMPFVGTWTVASMSENAATGVNSTDNVEQVLIQNPGQSGTWQVVIDHKGNLTNNQQTYSLVTTGLSAAPLSMEVARGGSPINVGTADGVSGTSVGSGTQLTYTISNVGGGQLELTTPVTISGQQNCSVTVNTQPASPINGGDSTNLVATVTPAAGGTWSFNISIANNDPEKDPYHWLVTGVAGSSGTVSFTPVADTYIDSLNPEDKFGSANDIRLNNQTGGSPSNRLFMQGLMRFDLSSIPPGTTIESATLDFVQNNTVSGSINIYDATGTWTEGEATWNNSNNLFGGTIYGTANLPGTAGGAVLGISLNASGLSRVQNWVNTPSGNHGFGITATNSGNSQNWMSLRSREHATSAHHPRLNVTYGGGAVEAPLMIVSGSDGVISNGGTESIPGTQQAVGTQLTYTIQNLGSANLTMTTPVTTTVGSNCSITVNTQPSSPVAPSGSTNLVLTVTPSSAGAWSATVSIANNDADKNPYTWTISGSAFGSHSVTYNGNTSDSGTAPVDGNNPYFEGATVTVLGNTGNLIKAGFTFAGWNTAANGSGTTYAPGVTFTMPGADVTLHAVWNALPIVNAGPDQNIFLAASTWTPLTLNPGLWLDAADSETITLNGSTVSQWADKSGLNRHATQGTTAAQPAYAATGINGKGVLTFDGSDDLFSVDLDFLAGVSHSAFIVTNPTIFSNIYGAANGSQAANSLHVGFNGNNYRMNFWANDFTPLRSANYVAGQANIVNYIWTTGTGKQILANGKSEGTNTNAGDIGTMSGGGRIGRVTGHPFFGGDIAEIIIIPGAVTAQSRLEIEGYLAHKWGLAANLANDHPYKASPPDGAAATTTLAGSASDPDEDPLTTQWTLEDGPAAASFADVSATNSDVTFTQEGIYTLRLAAADEFGSAFDDVTITVGPAPVERTLTYNGNGNTSGTAPVDPLSPYQDGATVTVLGAGDLAKTGHTFTGWNTSADGSGTPYAPAATFTINANTTLHAQWAPNNYTVTFDPNDGAAPVPTSKDVTFDAPYGTLATTTRTGYTFDGWFTAASGGAEVTEATMVSTANNHTLYAQWILTTVSVVTDVNTVNIPEGGTEALQVKLSDQPAESVTVTVARTAGDTDITVQSGNSLSFTTANWDTYQTVTLAAAIDADADNGTATITCEPSDPTYTTAEVTAIEIDKDTTLTITNDGNGTSVPNGAVIVEKGAASSIEAVPGAGYDFANWSVTTGTATFGDANAALTTVAISEPATIQANFALKTYTVSYNANTADSGTPPAAQTKTHGVDLALASNTGNLVKDGFVFDGWNTAADGSGTAFAEGATINLNADTTLYANWNSPPTVDAGADQTVYLTGAAPWTPADTSTVAWYDAADSDTVTQSGGAVSQWADKSGNNHHATQNTGGNQPTYNISDPRLGNQPTIGYDQGFKYLQTPTISSIRNVYVVTYYDDPDNTFDSHRVLFSDTGNSLKLQGTGSNWVAGAGFDKFRDGSTSSSDANALPMGPTLWTAKGTASHTNTVWRILGGASDWQYWEYGAVGEVILTDGTEDLATQHKIEGYLAHKWGTAANLPADHPYKDTAPGSPTAVATLNGTVSDVDSDPLTHLWTKDSGPAAAVTLDDDTALDTSATFSEVGTYTLRLTANDGFSSAYDEVTITVEALVETRTVTYYSNGNTSGEAPVDPQSPYEDGATVTVLGAGTLARTSHTFNGWNTSADGSGTPYAPDDTFTINADTALHAQWSPNPVDSFAITGVPSQVTVGTTIENITLTALDAMSNTAITFTGTVTFGGTAGITGTSASFVDGVRSGVSITPMVLGNDLTLTVDDGSGHTGSRTFNVVSAPYDDWSSASGLAGEDADPAAILKPDGMTNLEKFAFGMNPTVANFRPLEFVAGGELTAPGAPTLGNFAPPGNPDDERAVFTRRKDHAAAGLVYTVHFSADLKQWTASAALPTLLTDATSTSDHEVVSVPFAETVPVEGAGDPRPPQFMRVTITME